ncbi:unnamed protein product [Urochloa humidicola]
MDEMEEYTVNDDLRAAGLAADDDDDLSASAEALFGSSLAPINVDGVGDTGGVGGSVTPMPSSTPTSMPSPTTGDFVVLKRVRSSAWNDFAPIFETLPSGRKLRVSARCRHCKHVLSGRSSGGTGHLLRHQRQCLKKAKHASLVQSRLQYGGDGSVIGWEYKPEVARRELCRLISRLDLPLGFGYEEAFEKYIKRAHNPRFSRVSRQTTTRDLEKYFLERRNVLIESLQSVSSVCLTSDIWSGNAKEDYLSVVIHFVTADWEMEKRVIGLRLIDCAHTGANIAKRVETVIAQFGLTDKVFAVTLDNAASNSRAMSQLIPKFVGYLGPDPEPLDNAVNRDNDTALRGLLHQRCACHIINLIVKSGLKRIKSYLEAFRSAISYLNSSNLRIGEFHNYCLVKGFNPRKFGLDMDVRWNSTYLMLKHLLPYKSPFSTFIAANYGLVNGQPLLSEGHWTVAEKIMEFLEIFYESTVALSGVYYPTSPLMLHHILDIASHLHARETDPLLMSIVTPMKLKFLKYWQNIPLLYSFAFILDPRAKIRSLHNALQLLGQTIGVDYGSYFNEVRTDLYKLYNKYETKFGAVRTVRPNTNISGGGKKKAAWGKIYGAPGTSADGSSTAAACSSAPVLSELTSYLDSDTVTCFDDDFDILTWWHEHKLSYPILSILAKDIMSVLVSTVSSESCFSLTGRVIEERRRRLTPQNVEILTCVKDWESADARTQHDVNSTLQELKAKLFIKENEEGEDATAATE